MNVPVRVLDPVTAVIAPGQSAVGSTAYVADRLLVDPSADLDVVMTALAPALAELGWMVASVDEPRRTDVKQVARREYRGHVTLTIEQGKERLTTVPDAWVALQHLALADPRLAALVHLDHLVAACPGYWDGIAGYWDGIAGYWDGIAGYWDGIAGSWQAPAEFGRPGFGGKAPVSLVIADPARSVPPLEWAPVVVMLDTGIGPHPWFPRRDSSGHLVAGADERSVVTVHGAGADDTAGVSDPMTGTLDRLAGHGTFIAGIVRQVCPAARLVSYAMLGSTGSLTESELLDRLSRLVDDQHDAIAAGDRDRLVDVVSLSIGYYHEKPEDAQTDALLSKVLRDLGRVGVVVVAAAGNDATARPLLPAGFAAAPARDGLPVLSVGAQNPNFDDISLFSNGGAWVTHHRRGAAIVSTLPIRQNASGQESTLTRGSGHRARATIDRDDYRGGFGTWSGTSFAAPVLAGEVAAALLDLGPVALDPAALVARGEAAVKRLSPLERGFQ